jgi:hypothetical protein
VFLRRAFVRSVAASCLLLMASVVAAPEKLVSKVEALAISRNAAVAKGYNMKQYRLDTFGNNAALGPSKWLFMYIRDPTGPGDFFFVEVDRKSGTATVQPGE